MPKGPKGEKRPADVIGNAVKVMKIATGEESEALTDDGKDKAAVSLGKRPSPPGLASSPSNPARRSGTHADQDIAGRVPVHPLIQLTCLVNLIAKIQTEKLPLLDVMTPAGHACLVVSKRITLKCRSPHFGPTISEWRIVDAVMGGWNE